MAHAGIQEDGSGFQLIAESDRSLYSSFDAWRANETTGNYQTEEEAKADFLRHVNDDHWEVLSEVTGRAIFPKHDCDPASVRVDYVLFPKESLITSGWTAGPICIEVKRSGKKLGPVVSQAIDYMRCCFTVSRGQYSGLTFRPKFCIVFPLARVQESLQSVMASERVGHAHVGIDSKLRIYMNGVCAYTECGGVFLRHAMKGGKKFGSR